MVLYVNMFTLGVVMCVIAAGVSTPAVIVDRGAEPHPLTADVLPALRGA